MPSVNCIKALKRFVKPEWMGLDVGCGGGLWHKLDEKYKDRQRLAYYGVDFVHRDNGIVADIYHLPFRDRVFDYVASAHVIEHLKNPFEAVKEMARVSKYIVFANIPRYTLYPQEVTNCAGIDTYYYAEHIDEAVKRGVVALLAKQWNKSEQEIIEKGLVKRGFGHSHFGKERRHVPHCQWFPNLEDGYKLFKSTGCFKKVYVEVCPSNCGESNVIGYL